MIFENYTELAKDQYVIKVKADNHATVDLYGNHVIFKEGLRVSLRSCPSLYMTIDSFQAQEFCGVKAIKAECVWLDRDNKLCRELFNLTSLVLHTSDIIIDYK